MPAEDTNNKDARIKPVTMRPAEKTLHPAWRAFIQFCDELGHGEIEHLKIQDGLPVLAETIKQKVRFT